VTATFLVGDVYDRMAELEDHSFDLIITSPPFLALRSYLPADHPDKDKEIGSEATPAEWLDTMLALTAEWRRLLAPHGSLAIELGDTYTGSGGGGGDYYEDGLRAGQPGFTGSAGSARDALREANARHWREKNAWKNQGSGSPSSGTADGRSTSSFGDPGWPLDQSLTGTPTLYAWSLAYGRNLLTGQPSPAGQWRIRNLKPWIRSNPPVGALGKKERPATSYITVACTGRDRWFDLDAVRTASPYADWDYGYSETAKQGPDRGRKPWDQRIQRNTGAHPGGAPPLDWWHQVDALIDDELNQRAGKPSKGGRSKWMNESGHNNRDFDPYDGPGGARGVHIRRRLEAAGYIHTQDALDISPRGYAGAHYAVWPPELVRQLVDEMCPRRVCTVCGQPSRRIVGDTEEYAKLKTERTPPGTDWRDKATQRNAKPDGSITAGRATLGWSDCGCGERCTNCGLHRRTHPNSACPRGFAEPTESTWRPGRVLDPFVGSGTTLAVASGMGRDSVGIDLDARNAHLAEQRVGMFLTVDWGQHGPTDELPPDVIDVIPAEDAL
jgi:hypothetical protein